MSESIASSVLLPMALAMAIGLPLSRWLLDRVGWCMGMRIAGGLAAAGKLE
ncbi:MAG TPA: hypothetical protein VF897_19725 [Roseiflexaceae bacterium]